ncbi:MAG: dehydrogenase, partial [Pirellulaceae bacterium]|nr:dehydrogenase [Pirellulaceae bacterium]
MGNALAWFLCSLAAQAAQAQGYAPDQAVKRMTLAEGLQVDLVASEPLVRQPVCIEFDDRGRLWCIQYLQYPNPEGLKRTQVDRYSRTKYDRVPEPPPHGPRGADRITILSDNNNDGVMDSSRDFIDGLNLTSGLAIGHGGLFVLNVPYLLFYADRNRDDVPDGPPEVLLSGFGMEDAHSVANSLTWGPDGWLYGCQGSTVTANIRGIQFQQGVWRYHPRTKAFELFCEGGGNSWGLDFDADGHLLYSTNYGGYVLLHGVQGGNYVKSFAKHGALHNPYAYGYFEHAPHKEFRGGHVTVGGIVYQGGALQAQFNGQYLAGDLLGHAAYFHRLIPTGSTFRTETVGKLLDSHDTWFAPTDVMTGPDGHVYVSDWHDQRTAHPDPDAQWDRSNGRILRLRPRENSGKDLTKLDFAKLSLPQLLDLHTHPNQWHVRRARQELAARDARSVLPELLETALNSTNASTAREAFWSYITLQGPTSDALMSAGDETLKRLLASPHAVVRRWTVRWIGDSGQVSTALAHALDDLAEVEPDLHVRSQLASMAARLPAAQALPVINANINRDIDHADPFLPLQWWWAVERHSVSGRDEVMSRFTRRSLWKSKLGRDVLLVRLVRRYMAEGTAAGQQCVLRLLQAAPDDTARLPLWDAMLLGWQESPTATLKESRVIEAQLAEYVQMHWQANSQQPALSRLAILFGNSQPREQALELAQDRNQKESARMTAFQLLAEHPEPAGLNRLIEMFSASQETEAIRLAALRVLSRIEDQRVSAAILKSLAQSPSAAMATQMHTILFSRRPSAMAWLQAIDRGELQKESTTLEQVRQLAVLDDTQIDKLVIKHWGKL